MLVLLEIVIRPILVYQETEFDQCLVSIPYQPCFGFSVSWKQPEQRPEQKIVVRWSEEKWYSLPNGQGLFLLFWLEISYVLSNLAILVSKRAWFLHYSLELVFFFFSRSYAFVILDKTVNKNPQNAFNICRNSGTN